jgi:ribosomal protein L1
MNPCRKRTDAERAREADEVVSALRESRIRNRYVPVDVETSLNAIDPHEEDVAVVRHLGNDSRGHEGRE